MPPDPARHQEPDDRAPAVAELRLPWRRAAGPGRATGPEPGASPAGRGPRVRPPEPPSSPRPRRRAARCSRGEPELPPPRGQQILLRQHAASARSWRSARARASHVPRRNFGAALGRERGGAGCAVRNRGAAFRRKLMPSALRPVRSSWPTPCRPTPRSPVPVMTEPRNAEPRRAEPCEPVCELAPEPAGRGVPSSRPTVPSPRLAPNFSDTVRPGGRRTSAAAWPEAEPPGAPPCGRNPRLLPLPRAFRYWAPGCWAGNRPRPVPTGLPITPEFRARRAADLLSNRRLTGALGRPGRGSERPAADPATPCPGRSPRGAAGCRKAASRPPRPVATQPPCGRPAAVAIRGCARWPGLPAAGLHRTRWPGPGRCPADRPPPSCAPAAPGTSGTAAAAGHTPPPTAAPGARARG